LKRKEPTIINLDFVFGFKLSTVPIFCNLTFHVVLYDSFLQ